MPKFTVDDLKKIKLEQAERLGFLDKTYLLTCGGTGCHATGSLKVMAAIREELESRELQDKVEIVETGCNGFCAVGPLMVVQPGDIFYQKIKLKDIPKIIDEHLVNGKPVETLMYKDPVRNKGLINPESIDDYISRDGYLGAAKALLEMNPEDIIEQMKVSGLRGRGGAGFPTGIKWLFASQSKSDIKYVLCNADEGDPGAFMDRSILEADPHAVLEGMVIAAKAINATKGYIYAGTEYPVGRQTVADRHRQAKERGLLGEDILGSGFNFD
jgi:(2Fe-2S) ferredoxin